MFPATFRVLASLAPHRRVLYPFTALRLLPSFQFPFRRERRLRMLLAWANKKSH